MSSVENIVKKLAESATGQGSDSTHIFDSERHLPTSVAHELGNILAVIRGYVDQLSVQHGQDPMLGPQLKHIFEAVERAQAVVNSATPPNLNSAPQLNPSLLQQPKV